MDIPVAVACNEAVNLANKYSDIQGRKFINGVLRRLQTVNLKWLFDINKKYFKIY